jgi:hypothetical protein
MTVACPARDGDDLLVKILFSNYFFNKYNIIPYVVYISKKIDESWLKSINVNTNEFDWKERH